MERRILIVGQSHTEALAAALRRDPGKDITVVNINRDDRSVPVEEKIRHCGYLPEVSAFDLVVSMLGGNFHNTLGLIENPIRFEFTEPGETGFTLAPGRELITYGLIRHFFSDLMGRRYLQNIKALKERCGRAFLHVAAPPPVGDNEHIANNPGGYFSDKVHLGVAPPALRRKLYNLHETVLREFCERESIDLLPPPPEAVTPEGFLDRRFWRNDPTHANADYGALVVDQIRRALGDPQGFHS